MKDEIEARSLHPSCIGLHKLGCGVRTLSLYSLGHPFPTVKPAELPEGESAGKIPTGHNGGKGRKNAKEENC
jgi:hypothetical protein